MTTNAHLSISFSGEELLVLAADLGYDPARTGASLPGDWTRRERELALDVARTSLRSRGVIVDGAGGREIAYAVAVLVDVVCAPVARVQLYRGDDGPTRFLVQADATVRAELRDGLHRFTPFATVDLLGWVGAAANLVAQSAPAGPVVEVDAQDYARARQGEPVTGIPAPLLAALRQTYAVSVRRRAGRVVVGGELAWVDAGDAGLWAVPTFDQPLAGPKADVTPSGPVRLEPMSAAAIAGVMAGFLNEGTHP